MNKDIKYKWTRFEAKASNKGDLKGVVDTVEWSVEATHKDKTTTGTFDGTFFLPLPTGDDFKPLAEVTLKDVLAWVPDQVQSLVYNKAEEHIAALQGKPLNQTVDLLAVKK